MVKIFRKVGWELNPNDKVVNAILKRCELNDGECPCCNEGATKELRMCPCDSYRNHDKCCCGLYVKMNK